MAYKVKRLHSVQSANFDYYQALCDIEIPEGYGNIDLSKSYINFYHQLTFTNPPPAGTLYNIVLQNPNQYLPTSAIIKKFRHEDARGVVYQDTDDLGVITTNLTHYEWDTQTKKIKYLPPQQYDNTENNYDSSYLVNFVRYGTNDGSYVQMPVKVNLKDISEFCSLASCVDTSKTGKHKLSMQLNKPIFTPTELVRFGTGYENDAFVSRALVCPAYTAPADVDWGGNVVPAIVNIPTPNFQGYVLPAGADTPQPYLVGRPVYLVGAITVAGAVAINQVNRISSAVCPNNARNTLQFELANPIPLLDTAVLTLTTFLVLSYNVANYTNNLGVAVAYGTVIPIEIPNWTATYGASLPYADMLQEGTGIYIVGQNAGAMFPPAYAVVDSWEITAGGTMQIYTANQIVIVNANQTLTTLAMGFSMFNAVQNGGGAPVPCSTITYAGIYPDGNTNPFYVGMPLQILGNNAGTDLGNQTPTIEAINRVNNQWQLTLSAPLCNIQANSTLSCLYCANVALSSLPAPTPVPQTTIDKVELVLYCNVLDKPQQAIEYNTWTRERFNMYSANEWKSFILEPQCNNIVICQASPEANPPYLLSLVSNLSSYRLKVDGVDLTNRDVITVEGDDSLSKDRINMTLNNLSKSVLNLSRRAIRPQDRFTTDANKWANANQVLILPNPVVPSPNTRLLEIALVATGGNLNNQGMVFKSIRKLVTF